MTVKGHFKIQSLSQASCFGRYFFLSLGFLTCKVVVGTEQTDFQPSSSLILCSGGVDRLLLPLIEIARNSENTGWEGGIEVHGIQLWLEGWRPLSVFWPLTLSGRRSRNSTTWLLHFPGGSQHRVTSRKFKGEKRGSYSRSGQAPSGMRGHTTNLIHGLVLNAPPRKPTPGGLESWRRSPESHMGPRICGLPGRSGGRQRHLM